MTDQTTDTRLDGEVLTAEPMADRLLSDRVIAAALAADGPLTYQQISAVTGIPVRTVKAGVRRLREDDIVETEPIPTNPKGTRHRLDL